MIAAIGLELGILAAVWSSGDQASAAPSRGSDQQLLNNPPPAPMCTVTIPTTVTSTSTYYTTSNSTFYTATTVPTTITTTVTTTVTATGTTTVTVTSGGGTTVTVTTTETLRSGSIGPKLTSNSALCTETLTTTLYSPTITSTSTVTSTVPGTTTTVYTTTLTTTSTVTSTATSTTTTYVPYTTTVTGSSGTTSTATAYVYETALSDVGGTATYGDTSGELTATLRRTWDNSPVVGATVQFSLMGVPVCGGTSQPLCPTTDGSGFASLYPAGLPAGLTAGNYTKAVKATFAGAGTDLPAGPVLGTLKVQKRDLWLKPQDRTVKKGQVSTLPTGNTCPIELTNGSAFVGNDTMANSLNLSLLRCSYTATNTSAVGNYSIVGTAVTGPNYTVRWKTGVLKVVASLGKISGDYTTYVDDSLVPSFLR